MPEADRPSFGHLADLAAACDPQRLLPPLHQQEGAPVTQAPRLEAATHLFDDVWLGVFGLPDATFLAAPFRVDSERLTRVVPGAGAADWLVRELASGGPVMEQGFSAVSFGDGHESQEPQEQAVGPVERPMLVDQTHESVVVGERAVVKWAVRAEPTPAPTLIAHLASAGFTSMPRPLGCVTWTNGGADLLLASVVEFLPGASDGWTWAVHDAGNFIARGGSLESSVSDFSVVGETIAEMHAAMARPSTAIPAPQQPAAGEELRGWQALARDLLGQAVSEVDGPEGERLVSLVLRIEATFEAMDDIAETTTIPVHGDLHIGQVLRWDDGFAVADFDGNPVLPVASRLSPQPAARDVAGMLQSIDHIGRVVLRRMEGADSGRVQIWIAEAQRLFLDAYRVRLVHQGCAALLDERLLLPMQAEQECREFLYAVRHLPRWRYVPDQALQALFPEV